MISCVCVCLLFFNLSNKINRCIAKITPRMLEFKFQVPTSKFQIVSKKTVIFLISSSLVSSLFFNCFQPVPSLSPAISSTIFHSHFFSLCFPLHYRSINSYRPSTSRLPSLFHSSSSLPNLFPPLSSIAYQSPFHLAVLTPLLHPKAVYPSLPLWSLSLSLSLSLSSSIH